jgi:hypothetical protein
MFIDCFHFLLSDEPVHLLAIASCITADMTYVLQNF